MGALEAKVLTSFRSATSLHNSAAQCLRQNGDELQVSIRRNHEALASQADHILAMLMAISSTQRDKGADLRSIVVRICETNMKIYKMVMEMQAIISQQLPPQVERQQPALFEDAHGRISPVHIEFINTFEAFQAVLEVRFRHVAGLRKVQRNEYAISDKSSKRKLNLHGHWDSLFLPGRKVVMSMLFQGQTHTTMSRCPNLNCETENAVGDPAQGVDIEW